MIFRDAAEARDGFAAPRGQLHAGGLAHGWIGSIAAARHGAAGAKPISTDLDFCRALAPTQPASLTFQPAGIAENQESAIGAAGLIDGVLGEGEHGKKAGLPTRPSYHAGGPAYAEWPMSQRRTAEG